MAPSLPADLNCTEPKSRWNRVRRAERQGRISGSNSVLGARRRAHVFQEMSRKNPKEEENRKSRTLETKRLLCTFAHWGHMQQRKPSRYRLETVTLNKND